MVYIRCSKIFFEYLGYFRITWCYLCPDLVLLEAAEFASGSEDGELSNFSFAQPLKSPQKLLFVCFSVKILSDNMAFPALSFFFCLNVSSVTSHDPSPLCRFHWANKVQQEDIDGFISMKYSQCITCMLRSVMLTINMIIVVTHQWEKCCASKALNKLHFPLFIQCNRWHKDGRTNQPFWHVYKAFKSWNGLLQCWKYLANAFYAQHILLEEAGF